MLELHLREKRQCHIVHLFFVRKAGNSKALKLFNELRHEGNRPERGKDGPANILRYRQIIEKRVQQISRVFLRKPARENGICD